MSAKHTPGPWVRFKVEINGSVHYDVLPAMRHGVIASWISEPDSILIAAAPALADALESILKCGAECKCGQCAAIARAALTLAGRRPNP